jgi:ATP-dependent Lon protease
VRPVDGCGRAAEGMPIYILGEMSVQGMLLKVTMLPERMQFAVEAGAKRILIPSQNKRDVAEVPDAILTAIQWQFYDSPTRAAILAMGMG